MNVEPDLGCGYQQRFFNGKQMMLELNSEGWVETDQGDRVQGWTHSRIGEALKWLRVMSKGEVDLRVSQGTLGKLHLP